MMFLPNVENLSHHLPVSSIAIPTPSPLYVLLLSLWKLLKSPFISYIVKLHDIGPPCETSAFIMLGTRQAFPTDKFPCFSFTEVLI